MLATASCRSARTRPGAGKPPSPSPGRPRPWPASNQVATMSLFGREPRPVYRVYAEDEHDGEGESFAAEAQIGPPQPTASTASLELRRRPVASLVVGLLVFVAAVVVVLVLSNTSRRLPRRSVSAAPAVSTVSAGQSRTATAPQMRTSTRRDPARRSRRLRRSFAAARAHAEGDARTSTLVPVPVAVERALSDPPTASVAAEFGFER